MALYNFSLSKSGLILVEVDLNMKIEVTLALDTGCTNTVIVPQIATKLGFNLKKAPSTKVTTGTQEENAKEINVETLETLGHIVENLPIIVFDVLVEQNEYDGYLGLDFFQNKILLIDFFNQILRLD